MQLIMQEEEPSNAVLDLLVPSAFVGRPPSVRFHNDWFTQRPSFAESEFNRADGAGSEDKEDEAEASTSYGGTGTSLSAQIWALQKKLFSFKVRAIPCY